jgi:hypothetical protein
MFKRMQASIEKPRRCDSQPHCAELLVFPHTLEQCVGNIYKVNYEIYLREARRLDFTICETLRHNRDLSIA